MKENQRNIEIAEHIFTGSIAMVGVCLTVITLFNISNSTVSTYNTDELLAVDAFIFIISSFISYMSLRKNNDKNLEWIADITFFIGMCIMVFVGLLIVFFP
jgi:uncharacterized membrane protein YfcA